MTSLTINTPATGLNAVLSISSFSKTIKADQPLIRYTISTKSSNQKSSFKLSSMDWDVNMNELEFE